MLILIGEGGLAKSTTFRDRISDEVCWISGYGMPFSIYMKLYRHRDQLVVLDDLDNLYAKQDGITLLKCLCQTEQEKNVAWLSGAKALDQQNTPREFVTQSKVAIIANEWQTLGRNVAALEDRGHVLWFAPSPLEIHRQVRLWFSDDEIYDWFGQNLHLIKEPSMRMYFKAQELKRIGLPWRRVIPESPKKEKLLMVRKLLLDADFETQEERAREFTRQGQGCRATYFNYLRVFQKQQQ